MYRNITLYETFKLSTVNEIEHKLSIILKQDHRELCYKTPITLVVTFAHKLNLFYWSEKRNRVKMLNSWQIQ